MMRDNIETTFISENPGNVKRVRRNYINKYNILNLVVHVIDAEKFYDKLSLMTKNITLK